MTNNITPEHIGTVIGTTLGIGMAIYGAYSQIKQRIEVIDVDRKSRGGAGDEVRQYERDTTSLKRRSEQTLDDVKLLYERLIEEKEARMVSESRNRELEMQLKIEQLRRELDEKEFDARDTDTIPLASRGKPGNGTRGD